MPSSDEIERRLRERGQRLASASPLSEAVEDQLRGELAREAWRGARRARGMRRSIAIAAVAAALLLLLRWPGSVGPGAVDLGAVPFELALLDPDGRTFADRTRSTGTAGSAAPLPASLLVEVVADADAHVRVVFYDPLGHRRLPAAASATEEREWLVAFPIAEMPLRETGRSVLTAIVLVSGEPVPDAHLEALPMRLGLDRGAALEEVVADLQAELGCAVQQRSVTLTAR